MHITRNPEELGGMLVYRLSNAWHLVLVIGGNEARPHYLQ